MARTYRKTAFINVPYDEKYQDLYLTLIAGLTAFGLDPRATLEIPGGARRLDRIFDLIKSCQYSFHDLSRVELDSALPKRPVSIYRSNLASSLAGSKRVVGANIHGPSSSLSTGAFPNR